MLSYLKKHRLFASMAALLLAATVALTVILLSVKPTMAATADPTVTYHPHSTVDVSDIVWDKNWYQSFYDAAYSNWAQVRADPYFPLGTFPNGTSAYYNGTATPDHIVINEPSGGDGAGVGFFGYNSAPFFDMVYTQQHEIHGIEFDLVPTSWNFHCFKRTGFFVKSTLNPNGTITGFAIVIGHSAPTIRENSPALEYPDGFYYDLFYVENMDVEAYNNYIISQMGNPASDYSFGSLGYGEYFRADATEEYLMDHYMDANYGFPQRSVGSATVTLLASVDPVPTLSDTTPQMHFRYETSGTGFRVYLTPNSTRPTATETLLFEQDATGVTGEGFGLFTQYTRHICPRLTSLSYDNFVLQTGDYSPAKNPVIKFHNINSNTPIQADYICRDMWVGDTYDITPPPVISYNGVEYYYSSSDRASLQGIPVTAANNTVTLNYIQMPSVQKDARIPGLDNVIHNGTAETPYEVPFGENIEYTITVTNPNSVAFSEPLYVQDCLPAGMEYVSHSPASGVKDDFGGQDRVTWTVPQIAARGTMTFTITATPTVSTVPMDNWATLIPISNTGLSAVTSNHTYHEASREPIIARKDAQVQRNGTGAYEPIDNGDVTPVSITPDDIIKYTITATKNRAQIEPYKYDVVFCVDWSASMGPFDNASSGLSASRYISQELAKMIIDTYPGSRVAFQGINLTTISPVTGGSGNLSGDARDVYLQADTPFVDNYVDYNAHCANAYSLSPMWTQDDCALFFRAAFEKLYGPVPGTFGFSVAPTQFSNGLTVWGSPLSPGSGYPAAGQAVQARSDTTRIPLIVLVSDWQLTDVHLTQTQQWLRMFNVAQQFHDLCPTGIFLPIHMTTKTPTGTDPLGGTGYTTLSNLANIGEGKWGYLNAQPYSTNEARATAVLNLIKELAPLTDDTGTVKDVLPAGLEIVSYSPAGANVTYNAAGDQYTIEWSMDSFPDGTSTYEIICKVSDQVLDSKYFDNTAVITSSFQDDCITNTTHHILSDWQVKTKFMEFYTEPSAAEAPLGKAPQIMEVMDSYAYYMQQTDMDNIVYNGKTYTYYGYTIDNGTTFHTGPPPDPVFTSVQEHKEIILYFRTTYQIIEQFHGDSFPYYEMFPDASPITVYSGDSWTPSNTSTFIPSLKYLRGTPYNLIPGAYKLDSDASAIIDWTIPITNIQQDHYVIYPYLDSKPVIFEVTETFRKYTDPTQRVNATSNPDIITDVFGGEDFSPGSSIPPMLIGTYSYVGFQIGGGDIIYSWPSWPLLEYVTTDYEITYLYAELASKTAQVIHGGVGEPDPEETGTLESPVHVTLGDHILYIIRLTVPEGLVVNGGNLSVYDELPYGVTPDASQVSHGGVIDYNPFTDSYSVSWDLPMPGGTPPGTMELTVRVEVTQSVTLLNRAALTMKMNSYIDTYYTNYTVHDYVTPGDKVLHIRQIVLNHSAQNAELPAVGYFRAKNTAGVDASLLSTSGLWNHGATPYSTYTMYSSDTVGQVFTLRNIIPAYYDFVDYELTTDASIAHDRTHLSTGNSITLDYTNEHEYWVTVYLRPRLLNEGRYTWNYKTNNIGLIWNRNV